MTTVLTSAYWPNLQYFYYLLHAGEVVIEQHDAYQKQSYRNRTQILSANGVLNLVIPVVQKHEKMPMHAVEIDYREKWQIKHWRAIESAYKNSPFFDFFEDELIEFYKHDTTSLIQYNHIQLQFILKLLRRKSNMRFSDTFEESYIDFEDKRFSIHPKINFEADTKTADVLRKPYYQTFGDKFPFVPNLSVLDLIFNEGKYAAQYLQLQ